MLMHILREANRCADVLAKMGAEQNEEAVRMLVPPNEVVEEIMCDLCFLPFVTKKNK